MKTLRGVVMTAIWVVGMPLLMYASLALTVVGRGNPDQGDGRLPIAVGGGLLVFVGGIAALMVLSGRVARWRRLSEPPIEHLPPGH